MSASNNPRVRRPVSTKVQFYERLQSASAQPVLTPTMIRTSNNPHLINSNSPRNNNSSSTNNSPTLSHKNPPVVSITHDLPKARAPGSAPVPRSLTSGSYTSAGMFGSIAVS